MASLDPKIIVSNSEHELIENVAKYFLAILNTQAEVVTVGVSGGSMPKILCPILKMLSPEQIDKLKLFAVDERLVPLEDHDSNAGTYLIDLPAIFKEKFAYFTNPTDVSASKEEFIKIFKNWGVSLSADGFPIFDVLFLGMGPDGHTCSLFPDHSLLKENHDWVATIEDSPKPPPRRVTITFPVVNNAKHVAFIATGESKAQVLKEIIDEKTEKYPAGLVKPKNSPVFWFVDGPAAKLLDVKKKSEL